MLELYMQIAEHGIFFGIWGPWDRNLDLIFLVGFDGSTILT